MGGMKQRIIEMAAFDYDLDYEVVEKVYNKAGNAPDFYVMLEDILKENRNKNNGSILPEKQVQKQKMSVQ